MVRYKKRYLVVQLDRESDLLSQLDTIKENQLQSPSNPQTGHQSLETNISKKKRKKELQCNRKPKFKRALIDPRPLFIPDSLLTATLKDLVGQIHGDFGRASVTTGLRTIYSNAETRLCMIQTRHGPHRLLASSLPFLNKIKDEKIVPRLIYTGATIRHCYQKMLEYQKQQLNIALNELGKDPKYVEESVSNASKTSIEKTGCGETSQTNRLKIKDSIEEFTKTTLLQELEKKLMNIRSLNPNNQP